MKIALCQINPTVGDFSANYETILAFTRQAASAGSDVALFPELSVCGYPPRDLLYHQEFINKNLETIEKIAENSPIDWVICGFVHSEKTAGFQKLYNAAAVLHAGKIKQIATKSLLPSYDVFDERRYFYTEKKTHTIKIMNKNIGLTICEDLWTDPELVATEMAGKANYKFNPIDELANQELDAVVNLSASPYWLGKPILRQRLLEGHAKRLKIPFLLVNQIGANDDLIFDGSSLVVDQSGKTVCQGAAFAEEMILVNLDQSNGMELIDVQPKSEIISDSNECIRKALILGIQDYFRKCGFKQAIIGLSGGADSSLVASLAVDALGADSVIGIMMPSRFTSEISVKGAKQLADNYGMRLHNISIEPLIKPFESSFNQAFNQPMQSLTHENLQARIRGTLLMAVANDMGGLVLSTGNKSELAVGYCTLYGDMNGGLAVISDVLKTRVYDLCRSINKHAGKEMIPTFVIDREPSAELRENQRDQDSLPPYPTLDRILRGYIEEHKGLRELVKEGLDEKTVATILQKVDQNEYKRRQAALGLKVSPRAFGQGRRLPIAHRFPHLS